jgi:hypothetical protein
VKKTSIENFHAPTPMGKMGFIDDCKTNVQGSLFRANFEKCFVSGHDFSRAEKGL